MKRNNNKSKHVRKGLNIMKPCDDKLVAKKQMKTTEAKNRRTICSVNTYILFLIFPVKVNLYKNIILT